MHQPGCHKVILIISCCLPNLNGNAITFILLKYILQNEKYYQSPLTLRKYMIIPGFEHSPFTQVMYLKHLEILYFFTYECKQLF